MRDPAPRPAGGEGQQAPDRLFWNLAILLLIPLLVLLVAAVIAVRRARERQATESERTPAAVTAPVPDRP